MSIFSYLKKDVPTNYRISNIKDKCCHIEGRIMKTPDRFRNTLAQINLAAIGYNIKQLKKLLPAESKVMTVVKADGYGHGSIQVAKTALDAGVDFLMVALLEEAVT